MVVAVYIYGYDTFVSRGQSGPILYAVSILQTGRKLTTAFHAKRRLTLWRRRVSATFTKAIRSNAL